MKDYQQVEREVRNEQHYDDWFTKSRGAYFEESERKQFIRLARKFVPSPKSILDIGCGDGRITREAAASFDSASVIGVDFSLESLKRAKARQSAASLVCASAFQLPVKSAKRFDLIVSSEVLCHWHLPDAILCLRSLRGFLEPGGAFVFSVPSTDFVAMNNLHEEMWGRLYVKYFSEEDLRYLARETGFRHECSRPYGYSAWLKKYFKDGSKCMAFWDRFLAGVPYFKTRYAPWRIAVYRNPS